MTFSPEQIKALEAKLDASAVKTREQGKSSVSYIESWHVIAEANRIFGFDGWSRETVSMDLRSERPRKIAEGKPWEKDGWGVSYTAKVRVTVGDVVREGVGAGHGIDVDLGQAHESAIKEAESDAAKRALMTFGNPFGLALYDKSGENVERSNGSTRPAPKPSINSSEMFDALSERVNMAQTFAALKITREMDTFQHDAKSMTKADQERLRQVIASKEATFAMGAG